MKKNNIYDNALRIQDASNFIAIARELYMTSRKLIDTESSTNNIVVNPAIILILDKLNSLANRPGVEEITEAYKKCKKQS